MNNCLLQIDVLIDNIYKGSPSSYLLELEKNIKAFIGNVEFSDGQSFLFSKETDKSTQRFIAVCFIRIIANDNYNLISENKHQIFKFIQLALPELCFDLKITEKISSFEKEKIFRDFVIGREKEFDDVLKFNASIAELNIFQQNLRRLIAVRKNNLLIFFTDTLLSKSHLDTIFNRLNEYLAASEENKFQKYNSASEVLSDYVSAAMDIGTRYSMNYIHYSFKNIQELIKKDVENSPYYLPSDLSLRETEKKYPFSKKASGVINIEIVNKAKGYAQNSIVRLLKYNSELIQISPEEQFIGNVKLEPILVEFNYEMKDYAEQINLQFEISWTYADGQSNTRLSEVSLFAQPSNIDWENMKLLEPYNLEPVENDFDLIGREVILQKLKGMLGLPIGSSYIFGQRRVGKTSIVKTLLNSSSNEDLLIYYIEAGDWSDANDAAHSMNNLGEKICKKIKRHNPKFSSLIVPIFDGSLNKISDFLDEVIEIDSKFRMLIILDEFDRISKSLYERGEIGKSFGLTLRSISNRSQFGAILVGGEKLEYILSQWQEFNKFSPIRVDYFSKERDWEDFKKLVKKPVEGLLEISDAAINLIYGETAGNPYFTKKICMELFRLMVDNRDIHVTPKEMLNATLIARSSANIGATDFSHFWEDGIKGKAEKEEETSLKRRKILIAMSSILKAGKELTKERIADYALEMGLNNSEVEKYLIEFEQRKILNFQLNRYEFVVSFFRDWLLAGGADKIIASFEEEERVSLYLQMEEKVKIRTEEIIEILPKIKIYRGKETTQSDIRSWLEQFGDTFDQRLIFKLLQNFKLYAELEIRNKMELIFGVIRGEFAKRGIVRIIDNQRKKRDEILVSYLDKSPGKGASYFTKLFADVNNIYTDNVCAPELIEKKLIENSAIKSLVIIDDFIGSGNTLANNVKAYFDSSLCDVLREKKIFTNICAVTGFVESKEKLEDRFLYLDVEIKVVIADLLNEEDRCFSSTSSIFATPAEAKQAKNICLQKGEILDPKFPLGYSNCECLIAFPMNCPNNTLPIFWKETSNWQALFKRN